MEEAELLLSVVEKCAGHHHKLGGIASEAMARLLEINEECRQAGLKRAEEARAAEAEAKAEAEKQAEEDAAQAVEEVKPRSIPRTQVDKTNGEPTRRI